MIQHWIECKVLALLHFPCPLKWDKLLSTLCWRGITPSQGWLGGPLVLDRGGLGVPLSLLDSLGLAWPCLSRQTRASRCLNIIWSMWLSCDITFQMFSWRHSYSNRTMELGGYSSCSDILATAQSQENNILSMYIRVKLVFTFQCCRMMEICTSFTCFKGRIRILHPLSSYETLRYQIQKRWYYLTYHMCAKLTHSSN